MTGKTRGDRSRSNPPSGGNEAGTHALRAGKDGPTQRKQAQAKEPKTRDAGRDDRRPGSDSNRS